MHCTDKIFSILSNMCFLIFFCVAGKHVGGKASMQGEYTFSSVIFFPFNALNCLVYGARKSINKPHLFGKYFCFTFQISVAYVWLSKLKTWLLEKILAILPTQSYIKQLTLSAAFLNKKVGWLKPKSG